MRKISPVSVNVELCTLRAAFYTAVRWKLLAENPLKKVPLVRIPDREPTYLAKDDFQRLLSLIREQWLKDLVAVAVCTGMRQGELLSLEWINIHFDRQLITVTNKATFRTKTGKIRTVPMNGVVHAILQKRFMQYSPISAPSFSVETGPCLPATFPICSSVTYEGRD